MKLIILAAGQGTRLRPLTNDKPKCMVELFGKKMIDHILEVAENYNFNEVIIIGGYKFDVLKQYLIGKKITFVENERYDSTNMVTTLMCAKELFNDDIIISYSDIIYNKNILQTLLNEDADIAVSIDLKWQELWKLRMENILDDAETLKFDDNYNLLEIGKKTDNLKDIQGQYIGLIKVKQNSIKVLLDTYNSIENNSNLYMTDLIQTIIDNKIPVKASLINAGWFEVDSIEDKENYENKQILF